MPEAAASGAELDAALDAARSGADWAVAVLFRELQPQLLRYLRTRAADAAEDLASEVWCAAAQRLPGFAGDHRAFRAFLYTVARRQVISHWRQSGRRRTEPADDSVFDGRAGGPDPEAVVLDELAAQDAVQAVDRALPADQAEVVLLRVVAGLEVAEVAGIMGQRPGTVRVMQHRALRRLAGTFAPEGVTR